MRPSPAGPHRAESIMPNRQLDRLMWAQAYEAMERAQRLHRQFFHRAHSAPCWEAPVDIFETDTALTIVIALPGVDPDQVQVTLSAGVLIVSGERPLTRRIEECADPSAGDSARAFSAADRVAAGATRNLRPASRQWLPDAAAAQVLRISAMALEDRELRTSGSARAPAPR